MIFGNALEKRMNGNGLLWVILMGALLSACGMGRQPSNYTVTIPILTAAPHHHPCNLNGMETTCTCFVRSDAEALIRQLKAACVANGGSDEECQTKRP